jgi:predicted transcriptional regulator
VANPADIERFEKVRVSAIMIPIDRYPSVEPDCSLKDAIAVMKAAQLEIDGRKSLPRVLLVIDRDKDMLLGVVRRRDIMRGLEPPSLVSEPLDYRKKLFDVTVDPNLSEMAFDKVVHGIQEQSRRPVREIMRPIKATIDANDHIIKAVYEMVSGSLTLLPVLADRELVGVLRTVEAFEELARLVE